VESPQWSARCTVAIFDVLSSDAPSESVSSLSFYPGKIFNSSPTMMPEMLALEVTSGLCRGKPNTHQLYVTMNNFKGGLMDADSRLYRFNSENWVGMHRQVRS
jgi:hypothetical protein